MKIQLAKTHRVLYSPQTRNRQLTHDDRLAINGFFPKKDYPTLNAYWSQGAIYVHITEDTTVPSHIISCTNIGDNKKYTMAELIIRR